VEVKSEAVGLDLVAPELCTAVLRAGTILSRANLMPGNQGNLSVRDPQTGKVAITPHDYPYDKMTTEDLVVVDVDGNRLAGRHEPSFDVRVHCTVYRERPDVGAVIHTEPAYVNAFGAVGLDIEAVTTTGLKSANGTVPVMPFRFVRDEDFARAMLELMADRHAVVWGSHGLLLVGSTIQQALDRTLGVEFNARVSLIARSLGTPRSLAYLDAAMILD
jgi:L-ribulose-5-phosphate 4-epimerase